MDFQKLKDIIENNNTFLITAHVNPDADAIGSELALYYLLKKLNKKVHVINHSATPYNLNFLDTRKVIQKYKPEEHETLIKEADVLFALDLNHLNRIVSMVDAFKESKGIKVCIDHHQDHEEFVDYFFIDTDYSATGEIIYDFIEQTNIVELNYDIALQIYAAIVTDTGAFKYDRTTPKVHYIAAKLLEKGVNPTYVFDQLYDQSRISKLKLLGETLTTLKLDSTGQIGYMLITKESLRKTGAVESDVDGFVNYCLAVENVKIGLLFFELKDGVKVSFRSKGDIPINKLAAEFDGGGHLNAAGTRLFNIKLEELLPKVLKAAGKYIPE